MVPSGIVGPNRSSRTTRARSGRWSVCGAALGRPSIAMCGLGGVMLEAKLAGAVRRRRDRLEADVGLWETSSIIAAEPTLVHQDIVLLDLHKSRAAFATAAMQRCAATIATLDEIEAELLRLYH